MTQCAVEHAVIALRLQYRKLALGTE